MKNSLKVRPVILCGGSGSRLWPISSDHYPKQFIEFMDKKSLFEITLLRVSELENSLTPILITNKKYKFIIQNILKKNNYKAHIILEIRKQKHSNSFLFIFKVFKRREINVFFPCDII